MGCGGSKTIEVEYYFKYFRTIKITKINLKKKSLK